MTKAQLQAAHDALKAEADAMRAELAVHRAHVCPYSGPIGHWQPSFNVCAAGAAGYNPVQVWQNTAAAQPTVIKMMSTGMCAGAAAPPPMIQTFWVTT